MKHNSRKEANRLKQEAIDSMPTLQNLVQGVTMQDILSKKQFKTLHLTRGNEYNTKKIAQRNKIIKDNTIIIPVAKVVFKEVHKKAS